VALALSLQIRPIPTASCWRAHSLEANIHKWTNTIPVIIPAQKRLRTFKVVFVTAFSSSTYSQAIMIESMQNTDGRPVSSSQVPFNTYLGS
jgi:hypothetical protein